MSDRAPEPGGPGDEPAGDPEQSGDAHEAAMMRDVMRAQEQHREGGVEPGLDPGDEEPGA
ncbi:MAG TPA: hypothetical protein VLW44_21225 [Streptosporangiaceae bacterium]|nr:hypothetical protein [Streptosporangiaceae bacterium]